MVNTLLFSWSNVLLSWGINFLIFSFGLRLRYIQIIIFFCFYDSRVIPVFPPPPAVAKIQVLPMDLATLKDGMEVNDSSVHFFLM